MGLMEALHEQQELNHQLARANQQLALLSEVNRQIAESATLDEILDAALVFPQRLVPARAAALLLHDGAGVVETRAMGASSDTFTRLRRVFGVQHTAQQTPMEQRTASSPVDGLTWCLVVDLLT
jgi:nitrate/nitrite-specific signal transduction histidine kinase